MSRKEKLKALYDRLIPPHTRLPLWILFVLNTGGYELFKLFTFGREPFDLSIPLDAYMPVFPATALIYMASFPFWFIGYIAAARVDRARFNRFFAADVTAKLIAFALFVALPTVRTRPEIPDAPFDWLLRIFYTVDTPRGLFPSLHCLNSWMCYLGVRRDKRVPLGYRIFALLFAVSIFFSTITTAQHVLVDVPAGVFLAEGCWLLAGNTPLPKVADRFINFVNRKKERFFALFKKKADAAGSEE